LKKGKFVRWERTQEQREGSKVNQGRFNSTTQVGWVGDRLGDQSQSMWQARKGDEGRADLSATGGGITGGWKGQFKELRVVSR